MTTRTMGRGPFKGVMVEVYEGDNPHKVGTVFAPALGLRLMSDTGELAAGAVPQGTGIPAVRRDDSQTLVDRLERELADAKAALANATVADVDSHAPHEPEGPLGGRHGSEGTEPLNDDNPQVAPNTPQVATGANIPSVPTLRVNAPKADDKDKTEK